MKLRMLAVSGLLLASLPALAASDMGLKVTMEIEIDGQSFAKPSTWQPSGTTGTISVQNEFRLKVTPSLRDDSADLKFELFTTQEGVESAAGSPRIITKLGERSSLAWTASNGKRYKLSVIVAETEKPVR